MDMARPERSGEGRPPGSEPPGLEPPGPHGSRRARLTLVGVLAALFAAMLGYKLLHAGGLEQTALFYVGLPATIALVVAATARPRSAIGLAVAVVTIGLALAGPLLNEGVICLVMAAPLFYAVAIGIGVLVDATRDRGQPWLHAFGFVPLLAVLCLEGVVGSLPRDEAVSVTRTVEVTPQQFEAALTGTPRFQRPASAFLGRLPFPRPLQVEGTGLDVGDERLITFTPRKSLGIGADPTPRSMRLRVAGSTPNLVRFDVVHDTTTARWLQFRTSQVSWQPAAGGGTRVTWRLTYARTFDPGWYFGPLQQYGMRQAAGYLLDTFAS
jgi:hypothetical protein